MSDTKTAEPTVQLYIGASGQPVPATPGEENIYKDYVVKQNLILQEENKTLAKADSCSRSWIDDLEEQIDKSDQQVTQLKQYVRNFHSVGEIHRNIAKADLCYFHTVTKLEEREKLVASMEINRCWSKSKYLNPSYILTTLLVIYLLVSAYSTLYGTMTLICMAAYYFFYVHPVLTGTDSAQEQLKHDRTEIHKLLKLRKDHEKTLHGLERTMDIIGKFVDDAL